jgi:integrase
MTASQRLRVVATQTPSPLARSVEENLTSCKARGLSPKTVNQAYGWPLRSVFLPWDEEEGLRTPADVTPRALERLAANLLERPGRKGTLSRHSVHAYLRGVNQRSRWAKLEGEDVPARALAPLPRLPRSLPNVLSRVQITSPEDAAATERDRLIVRPLADTSLRVGELVGLSTGDLLQPTRGSFLKVRGKGDRGDTSTLGPASSVWEAVPASSGLVRASSAGTYLPTHTGPEEVED